MLRYNQFFISITVCSSCLISRRNRSRLLATARCSALGLFGLLYTVTCRCVCTCFWGCHKWSSRGMISVKWGERMVTLGYYIKFSRFAGAYPPPNTSSTGGSLRPLVRRGPVSPNNVLEKKKVCVLGKVCGHLASASELNLGQSGARAGASRGRV